MAFKPAPRSLTRRLNEQAVLDVIFHGGPISRANVAGVTGLSKPTVSSIVDQLERGGLVRPTGQTAGAVGRSATLYHIDARVGHVIGIDLGGSKVTAAIADLYGRMLGEHTEPTVTGDPDELVEQLRGIGRRTAAEASIAWSSVRAIVLGAPGTVDPATGIISLTTNIPDVHGRNLARELATNSEVQIVVENDVNLAAVGERWKGLARACESYALLAIGTGVGCGLVIDGELHRGARGGAGEIAFLPIGGDPFDPANRRRGTLEEAVGGDALAGLARRLRSDGGATSLPASFTTAHVFEAASAGDELALRVVDHAARVIALAIASLCATVAPELVVLGGPVGANVLLIDSVRRYVAELTAFEPPQIEQSALQDRGTLIGAVAVALQEARALVLAPPGAERVGKTPLVTSDLI